MSVVQDIGVGLSTLDYDKKPEDLTRGEYTEALLTQVCYLLGEVGNITKSSADMEFILGVVGSYILSKEQGKLPEDAKPPSYIFDDIMYPQIDTMELKQELIEEGEEEDGESITTTEDTREIS